MSRHVLKIEVTPAMAEKMLSRRRDEQIKRFDMRKALVLRDRINRRGYKENNDLWDVDIDGYLINGQHRAWAVKVLGITVTQHVIFDAPLDEFPDIDSHGPRNMTFKLALAGVPNYKDVRASLGSWLDFIHGRFHVGDANFIRSRVDVLEVANAYKNSAFLMQCVSSMVSAKNRSFLKSNAAFYKAVFSSIDPYLWQDFFDKLNGNISTTRSDVEFQLRTRLLETGIHKLKQSHSDALIVLAWNYRVANRKVKVLSWDKAKQGFPTIQGTTPERFASIAGLPICPEYVRKPECETKTKKSTKTGNAQNAAD